MKYLKRLACLFGFHNYYMRMITNAGLDNAVFHHRCARWLCGKDIKLNREESHKLTGFNGEGYKKTDFTYLGDKP